MNVLTAREFRSVDIRRMSGIVRSEKEIRNDNSLEYHG